MINELPIKLRKIFSRTKMKKEIQKHYLSSNNDI